MSFLKVLPEEVKEKLQDAVRRAQYLMGIGGGSDVLTSGEQSIFDVLALECQPPYCIFDVGANKGQFLNLALNTLSGNDLSIHCFEPAKESFRILSNRKSDSRIILNNIGISKKNGMMTLFYDKPDSAIASLTKRRLDHFGIYFNKSETIQVKTIDNYFETNHIERINLLKVDVEGHELDVFAGAENTFGKGKIDIATFEFGGCNIDTRTFFQDFWYFFSDVNMKLFRITPSGYLCPIRAYDEIDEQFRPTNFIALQNKGKINNTVKGADDAIL